MELGPIGLSELLFIAALALIVFGPRRLPEIGHALGRLTTKLRRATNELKRAWESEIDDDSRRAMQEASRQIRQVRDDLAAAGREAWTEGGSAASSAAAEARRALQGVGKPDAPAPAPAAEGTKADEP